MFYIIFFSLVLIATLALVFTKAYKSENPIVDKVLKVVVVVWMAIYFLNLFLPDAFAMRTFDDVTNYVGGENIWFAVVRWFNDVAFVILPIAIFFKKDLFNKFTAYAVVAICLLNVAAYFEYIKWYTSTDGAGIMALRFFGDETKAFFINHTFRSIYFGVSMFLELMLAIFITLRSFKSFKINKNVKSVLINVAAFVAILFAIIPIYVPQYLFKGYSMVGAGNLDNFKMGTFFHIVWMIGVIIEGVVLSLVFKKKSYSDRFILVLILAFALIMQYNQMFTGIGEITTHRMPFQLCNMAGLFILLMLITKNEKIYHFTIVINSVGAIIAMAMCDTTPYGITYIMNIHYVTEHTNVILVPILCATLGIFAPLKTKDIKHFVAGFSIYFVAILLIGGTFTGLYESTGNSYWNCNYLFMFNKAESTKILSFVGPLFDVKFKLFDFFTLSLVQLVVYVVFLAICTGAFFLIKFLLRKNTLWEDSQKNELMQN
ncbi:MAG: YwaF family protein [Clostridia bacterium]|nr:YwaF family protein [Clostridia bacterium]